jgi:hypothetical protein
VWHANPHFGVDHRGIGHDYIELAFRLGVQGQEIPAGVHHEHRAAAPFTESRKSFIRG